MTMPSQPRTTRPAVDELGHDLARHVDRDREADPLPVEATIAVLMPTTSAVAGPAAARPSCRD